MKLVWWLLNKLRKKVEPLDIKYHLDDIIVAYDDVDLILFINTKGKKK